MNRNVAGEALRRAIRWLSDEGRHDTAAVDEASLRFDLPPADAEFLLAHLREQRHADTGRERD